MTPLKRSFAVLGLSLAVALAATTAHAGQAKKQTTTPSKPAQVKVDSPNMARSISDWHTELGTAPQRTTSTASAPSGRTVTQPATNVEPASQRGNRGKEPAKPSERAREIPLRSIKQ